ncbi:FAD-dependent oxidoreductase domain-containing protein 1-like isoform X2 [Dysidea avara]|uniref:FAD-dependent oxidoreductase domain-containing protein 1-like isoform X2 n=1 Tax=Dysidea avara TaxID=196820 RepID=UPI00331EBFFD
MYTRASSALSFAGIRHQYSVVENIRLSTYSVNFLKNIKSLLQIPGEDPPDVQFKEQGYLLLADEYSAGVMEENHKLHRDHGASVELLSPNQIQTKFPYINTDGIALGSFGYRNEGWFDPWSLLMSFKKMAQHLGADYLHGEISNLACDRNKITSVEVTNGPEPVNLGCKWLVNAAGAWAEGICQMAGIGDPTHPDPRMHWGLPVKPRKRMLFPFRCSTLPYSNLRDCPVVIDYTGTYFRPEGQGDLFLTGFAPPEDEDPDGFDFEVDHAYFEEKIWENLAHRVPMFESIKLQNSWAGLYEYNTLDQNAILGPHPVITNLLFVNGFSGHGVQQSTAAGRVISDIVLHGSTDVIDINRMSFQRVIDQKPLQEKCVY